MNCFLKKSFFCHIIKIGYICKKIGNCNVIVSFCLYIIKSVNTIDRKLSKVKDIYKSKFIVKIDYV